MHLIALLKTVGNKVGKLVGLDRLANDSFKRETTCFDINQMKEITFNKAKDMVASYKRSQQTEGILGKRSQQIEGVSILGVRVTDKDDRPVFIGTVNNKMNNQKDNEIKFRMKEVVALSVDGFKAENCSVELVLYTQQEWVAELKWMD
jgi:hypothetical protein